MPRDCYLLRQSGSAPRHGTGLIGTAQRSSQEELSLSGKAGRPPGQNACGEAAVPVQQALAAYHEPWWDRTQPMSTENDADR